MRRGGGGGRREKTERREEEEEDEYPEPVNTSLSLSFPLSLSLSLSFSLSHRYAIFSAPPPPIHSTTHPMKADGMSKFNVVNTVTTPTIPAVAMSIPLNKFKQRSRFRIRVVFILRILPCGMV